MIITLGPWIRLSVNGISGMISKGFDNKTLFFLIGPEQEPGNHLSVYSPFRTPPSDDDQSSFAKLYRKLSAEGQGILQGPFGEDHPIVYARFCWASDESQEALLQRLTDLGIEIRVRSISHDKDEAKVAEAARSLSPWFDDDTVIEPDPEIARAARIKEEVARDMERWKAERESRPRKKSFFRRYFRLLLCVTLGIAGYYMLRAYW